MKKFLMHFKAYKGKFIISLFSALISTSAKLFIPFLAGKLINQFIQNDYSKSLTYIFIMLGLLMIGLVFRYIFDYLTNYIGQCFIKDLREKVYSKYVNCSIEYIDTNKKGDLTLRMTTDIENIQNGLVSGLLTLFDGVITILITLIFMFILNYALALLVLVLSPISIFASKFISKYNSKHFKAQAKSAANISSYTLESLNNNVAIEVFNIKDKRIKDYDKLNKDFSVDVFKANLGASIINPTTRLVNAFINASIILLGAFFIIKDVNLGLIFLVGDLSSFLTYASTYMKPFNEISDVLSEVYYAKASLERVDSLLNESDDTNVGTCGIKKLDSLTFSDVNFSYDNTRRIINNFSLDISHGKKIAIVGPTGCGKTTIINLLMGFYQPQEGSIIINNHNASFYDKKELRSIMGMVLQDSWIFHGTIRENISFSKPDASLDEIKRATSLAQLDTYIDTLPKGYDTIIDNSSGLSVGQRQLICVARTMLLNPEIIILDEATSNIDILSEASLTKSFLTLMEGKTSIVIAHRLSTIVRSDLIVVMKNGSIIEKGNHQELLNKKGFYYELFTAQKL